MKKTSIIVKEKSIFDINILINNTAYICSVTGKKGLLNIKTNQIIGKMDDYYTIYDKSGKFFYQLLDIQKPTKENDFTTRKSSSIRIYDALNEIMIADGWEIIKSYDKNYDLIVLKSPIDGKLHIYDRYACRKPTNIFHMALDDVELLYQEYNDKYFVVTINGKKGIYFSNCYDKVPSLITPIEFDNIEKMPNIIVFTQNNQKYFVYMKENEKTKGKTSILFDSISIDEKNKNIVYCKKDDITYVYNTYSQELLLKINYEEIKYVKKNDDAYNNSIGEFFFIIKQNGKFGLISSEINNEIRKSPNPEAKVTTLLQPIYDKIECNYDGTFNLEKDKKIGRFFGNSYHSQLVDPKYDRIVYLINDYYALYTGDFCDIGKVNSCVPYKPSITNCQVEANLNQGTIYKKDGLFGLLISDRYFKNNIIPNEYDKISCIGEYYFLLEKNGKKGIFNLGKIIIPVQYKDIYLAGHYSKYKSLKDAKVIYFALKKGEKEYELAKRYNYHYPTSEENCSVEFVSNHIFEEIDFLKNIMVFKDSEYTYVYDYEEKLLKTFPSNTIIVPFASSNEYDEKHDNFYCINGAYYYYKEGKFEEVFVEENDFYVTTYETDANSFEIKTLNKQEHDAFCEYIDTQLDDLALQKLEELSSDENTLKNTYPTLILRKIEK